MRQFKYVVALLFIVLVVLLATPLLWIIEFSDMLAEVKHKVREEA